MRNQLVFPLDDPPNIRPNGSIEFQAVCWADVTLKPGLSNPNGCSASGSNTLGLCREHVVEILGVDKATEGEMRVQCPI